jgi:IS30 family transposase
MQHHPTEEGMCMTTEGLLDLSPAEEAEFWGRYRRGENCSQIARAMGKVDSTLRQMVKVHGGFAPRTRSRSPRTITLAEREEISRGICAQLSTRQIAARLGRAASSVSREIRRHGGRGQYRALQADRRAWRRARRAKPCLLARNAALRAVVIAKLQQDWSPRQIAQRLPVEFPDDHSMRVSHETIYRTLFIQARGALKKELAAHLRTQRGVRRARSATRKGKGCGQIVGAISIRERPAEIEDRAVPGHWEGDLLAGSKGSRIITLVERHSRYVMLAKIPDRDSATVVESLGTLIQRLPKELWQSLTWDRGAEMANHRAFTVANDVQVYFCDPHSPWQRGSNENTNGLLRQYFPKGTDLSVHTQKHLDAVARKLNGRPRETLGFRTPAEKLSGSVALTA